MIDKKKVEETVEAYIKDSGYFLVDVEVSPSNEISIEIDSDESVPLDYCVELSRYVETKFDREEEDYELEVGSAGLTTPFKVLRQYQKYEGKEVEVQVKNGPLYVGELVEVGEMGFGVKVTKMVKKEGAKKKVSETEVVRITYDQVQSAKYSIKFK